MTDISSHRFFKNKRYQQLTLCIITFFIYFNTLSNEYALDDRAVITENTVTQKGIGGIKELLTNHYYYGQISHNTHIYRPVPSITHALEWQFFKKNPGISHLINILLFLFTVLVFFQLCTFFFKKYSQGLFLSFLASLIFAIHPLHTEVVANIKGRDELLSLLFLLLAFNYLLQHFNIKGIKHLLITGLFLLLALFSKESAALYILYLPLILFFFTPLSFSKSIIKSLPFMLLLPVYFLIIKSVIGWGKVEDQVIFNVPYLYASESAAFATKVFVILKYISLFIVPHPLICDYSYNHIPYINFSDYRFWLAFSINICLLVYALVTFKSKNIIAFCILFFYSSIAIVSNLFVQTGVIMAERSAYVGSVAFCIFLAILYHKFFMT